MKAREYLVFKTKAIKTARQMVREFGGKDAVYTEVWEKDGDGMYGNWGNPLYKSDKR